MYKVRVYDQGWVTMCQYNKEAQDWVYLKFETREEAQKAADDYKEAWGRAAIVVEA